MTESQAEHPSLDLVRRTHRTLDPIHAIVYFAREAGEAYAAVGVPGSGGYFASRSAAMGVVPPEVIVATFFNFNPGLVSEAMDGVWQNCTPQQLLDARMDAVDAAFRRLLDEELLGSDEMVRAATLARGPAEESTNHCAGRPLFAAHASLPWPEEPHLVLWHAVTLLREFRGDAHNAALLTAGLDGLDALVIHAASGTIPEAFLKLTRGWDDAQWEDAVTLHKSTGWLNEDGTLTESGLMLREEIEMATDRGAALPWSVIGSEGCTELRDIVRPWARTMSDAMFAGFGT